VASLVQLSAVCGGILDIEAATPGWPSADVLRMEQRVAPRNVSMGYAGDVGVRVRIIVSGWAYRFRTLHDGRRQILNVLLPGDTFGLETLFGQPAQTSVQTSTAITYLALSAADLAKAFNCLPEFRRYLFELILAEKVALEGWLVRLGQSDAEERIVGLLLSLHSRLQQCGLASGQGFALELTQQELADVLGLHVIHVNRVLGRLRARKLLSITGKNVVLHDHQGLAELAPPLSHSGLLTRQFPAESCLVA
jgi:CRP-like cAMP-binding protein